MPLQTGASATGGFSVGTAVYMLVVCALVNLWIHGGVRGAVASTVVCLAPLLVLLPLAVRWRAADILLDKQGFVVNGGPRHGARCAWADVDPRGTRIARSESPTITSNASAPIYATKLYVGRRRRQDLVLAEVIEGSDDMASVRAVLDAITSITSPPASAAPVASPLAPEVLVCDACGAPVVPENAGHVVCAHCGAHVYVPAPIRARFEASQALNEQRRLVDRLVRALLDQPHAGSVNVRLLFFLMAFFGGSLVANVAAFGLHRGDVALVALAAMIAGYALLRGSMAERIALRTLVFGYGAGRPAKEGAPPSCRRCGAPLPKAGGDVILVRCAYCEAENLLDIDLFGRQSTVVTADIELTGAMAARTRAHRRRTAALVVAGSLFVAGGVLYATSDSTEAPPQTHGPSRHR